MIKFLYTVYMYLCIHGLSVFVLCCKWNLTKKLLSLDLAIVLWIFWAHLQPWMTLLKILYAQAVR